MQEQYQKEVEMRQSHRLDKKFVMSLLDALPPEVLEREVAKLGSVQGRALSEYKYCIVMPQGDRSFQAIHSSERPNLDHVRNRSRMNNDLFVATFTEMVHARFADTRGRWWRECVYFTARASPTLTSNCSMW